MSVAVQAALAVLAGTALIALYTAWINGVFLPCPHCGRRGTWRFDPKGAEVEEKDEDGFPARTEVLCSCRSCGGEVVDAWSDFEGRTIAKASGGGTQRSTP